MSDSSPQPPPESELFPAPAQPPHAQPPESLKPAHSHGTTSISTSDEASIQQQHSIEEVWYLKEITFKYPPDAVASKRVKIITQNFNGSVFASLSGVCTRRELEHRPLLPSPPPTEFFVVDPVHSSRYVSNILILRGDIEIEPYGRSSVSYEHLSQLVGEYLLLTCPDVDISAALSIMPYTRRGMDLNPLFTGATLFRPAGSTGGELKLFSQANIKLVHGWLVDPESPEYPALERTKDYDSSVNLIVEADHVAKGKLVVAANDTEYVGVGAGVPQAGSSSGAVAGSSSSAAMASGSGSSSGAGSSGNGSSSATAGASSAFQHPTGLSAEDQQKVEHGTCNACHYALTLPSVSNLILLGFPQAIAIRSFIDNTSSQLTYYGLFALASLLAPGALVALFRNSHLSVLYKSPDPDDSALYTLVTDYVFLHESSVVWERIEDVEGGASTFVDSEFVRSSPAGGDYAGHTGESALAALEAQTRALTLEEQADEALARQLQHMEDSRTQEIRAQREMERHQRTEQNRVLEEAKRYKPPKVKKDRDCVIISYI
ncbi:hypothetical protein EIP91_010344 [Steccherinum ochraceum]|uniref:MINDY deubiquitinase domain-containing protein n=1 Tax=Steccherinum ochraceum TaxID=92696 RepID=A0A4R0R624_9APHY|nr:hypothetical protein EIP91_010344 [Steccherinum ochraceum]